jgi:serine/threonine protein kinase/DNA-binding NarL/FixJ family response regulator
MAMANIILLADPDPLLLQQWKGAIEGNGNSVLTATAGKEAFALAMKHRPTLCLVDSEFPDANGFAVCRSIKKRLPDTVVVVASAKYKGPKNRLKAREKFGATELLEKPILPANLPHLIPHYLSLPPLAPPQPKPTKKNDLEAKLEQTLSGLDVSALSGPKSATKRKTKDPSPNKTIQVDAEEIKKTLSRIREQENLAKHEAEALAPQFKVGETSGQAQGKLSSHDIFGDLISDIEKNTSFRPPKRGPIPTQSPSPGPTPQAQPSHPIPQPPETVAATPPSKPRRPPLGPKNNDYELMEKIAAGGMAEVWKARLRGEKGFEKIVAIKKILPHLADNDEFITMFIDEAKVAANLTHPNIAQIYELGKIDDTFFIAMEYVSGNNLRNILNRCKTMDIVLPYTMVAFIGLKLCNALDYAHKKRGHNNQPLHIVHRDISPQNILISQEGETKLVDFGIAKASIKAANTVAGSLKGKLLYMSPEQAAGGHIDHRSDIFSLGNLLYECLTGVRLFDGESEVGILRKVRDASYEPIHRYNSKIPKRLEDLIGKALAKSPDDRYHSAKDLEKELKTFLKEEKIHITETDVAEYLNCLDAKDTEKLTEFDLTRSRIQVPLAAEVPEPRTAPAVETPLAPPKRPNSSSLLSWIAALGLPLLLVLLYFLFLHESAPPEEPATPPVIETQAIPSEETLPDVSSEETISDIQSKLEALRRANEDKKKQIDAVKGDAPDDSPASNPSSTNQQQKGE